MTLSFTLDGLIFNWDAETSAWTTSDTLASDAVNLAMAEWLVLFPAYHPVPPLAFMTYLADHRELSDVVIKDLPKAVRDRIY